MAGKPSALVVLASVLLAFVRVVAAGFPLVSLVRAKKRLSFAPVSSDTLAVSVH
jgi:hypothetical protein